MRIGILGGTFNPIHIGHLILGEEAVSNLRLDKLIFVPAYMPPHKPQEGIVDASDRYRMVSLAIEDNPKLEVSDIELTRKGKSYSVETLRWFKNMYGKDSQIFFVTGSDSLREIISWKDVGEIFKLANFSVGTRPGYPVTDVPPGISVFLITQVEVSSTEIRRRTRDRNSIRYLVPEQVRKYIEEKGLYRG
jgi:nicotinate-nucleotide adenylyltransferase